MQQALLELRLRPLELPEPGLELPGQDVEIHFGRVSRFSRRSS